MMKDVRSPSKLCELCARSNKTSRLKLFQVNFEEAVLLCENNECTYPLGFSDSADLVVKRKFAEVVTRKRNGGAELNQTYVMNRRTTQSLPSINGTGSVVPDKDDVHQPSIARNTGVRSRLEACRNQKVALSKKSGSDKPRSISILEQINRNIQEHQQKKSESLKKTNTWAPYVSAGSSKNSPSVDKNVHSSMVHIEPVGKLVNMTECIGTGKKCVNVFHNGISENGNFVLDQPRDKISESREIKNEYLAISAGSNGDLGIHKLRRKSDRFPQWQNKDALCWLDVVLCLLVHNRSLEMLCQKQPYMKDCVLFTLLKAYQQARSFTTKIKTKSKHNVNFKPCVPSFEASTFQVDTKQAVPAESIKNSCEKAIFQTGAGPQALVPQIDLIEDSTSDSDSFDSHECPEVNKILNRIREDVWLTLEPKLHCVKGRSNSPVAALQWMFRENPMIGQGVTVAYEMSFVCENCCHSEVVLEEMILPSVSSLKSLSEEIVSVKKCPKCDGRGVGKLSFKRLPDIHLMHFIEGIPHTRFSELDIHHHGNCYTVTGVVQYKNNPDHFVLWIRDPTDDHWMECDDLKPLMCEFHPQSPSFAADQVHIVMWERVPKNIEDPLSFTVKPDVQKSENPLSTSTSSVSNGTSMPVSNTTIYKTTETGNAQAQKQSCQQTSSYPLSQSKNESTSVEHQLIELSSSSQVDTYLIVTSPMKKKSPFQINRGDIQQLVLPEKLQTGKLKSTSEYTKLLNGQKDHMPGKVSTPSNLVNLGSGVCYTPSVFPPQFCKVNSSVVQLVSNTGNPVYSYYAQLSNKQGSKSNSVTRPALDHLNKIKSNLSLLRLQKHSASAMQSSQESSVSRKGRPSLFQSVFKRKDLESRTKKKNPVNGGNKVDNSDKLPYLAALKPFLQKVPSPSAKLPSRHSFAGYTLQSKKVKVSSVVENNLAHQDRDITDIRKRKLTTVENGPPNKKPVEQLPSLEIEPKKVQEELQQTSNDDEQNRNAQECDILKNLYDALNLQFPANSSNC